MRPPAPNGTALDRLDALEDQIRTRPRPGEPGLGPAPDVDWRPDPKAAETPPPNVPSRFPPSRRDPSHKRSRWIKIAVVLVATLVAGLLAAYGYLQWRVGQIERIAVSALTPGAPPGGPTWLVVGSDSREGLDPNRPDAGGLISDSLFGQRSDAIILVRDVPDVGVQMLSLPRDLWFDPPGDGNATRINAA